MSKLLFARNPPGTCDKVEMARRLSLWEEDGIGALLASIESQAFQQERRILQPQSVDAKEARAKTASSVAKEDAYAKGSRWLVWRDQVSVTC